MLAGCRPKETNEINRNIVVKKLFIA